MATKPRSTRTPRLAPDHQLDDQSIGLEARVVEADHQSLKLWLRLLACSTQIEIEIRRRLRERFGVSLPRFDYLAQLHRHPDGLRMNALSRYLMVSGGNVTGLTDELEKDGLVTRDDDPDDRRSYRVRLTPAAARPSKAWRANTKAGWSSSSPASSPTTSRRCTTAWAGCACSCRPRRAATGDAGRRCPTRRAAAPWCCWRC
jgi:DNA-binding MarR family transcriptional regulator